MFNSDDNMVMPVAPSGFGNSGFGGDGWWIILLFILLGYNNNGWGNNANSGAGNLYPWINQSEQISNGFRDQNLQNGITDISSQLCNGFAGVNATINSGVNSMSSQFAQCCCDNRLASADLKYTIATENCADRYEAAQNTRDIIENNNRNNQAILDKLCQLEMDAKNQEIAALERQLTMANLAASQNEQTAQILANNAAQTMALEQYLNPAPIPAYVVQNPNCCTSYNGCGCA